MSENPILRDIERRGLSLADIDAPNVRGMWSDPDVLADRYPGATSDQISEVVRSLAVTCDHEGGVWPGLRTCADCGAMLDTTEQKGR